MNQQGKKMAKLIVENEHQEKILKKVNTIKNVPLRMVVNDMIAPHDRFCQVYFYCFYFLLSSFHYVCIALFQC